MPLLKTNRGLLGRCLLAVTIFALAFSPHAADAAQHKKKKTKAKTSHHRPALSVAPIQKPNSKAASILIDAETGTILASDQPDALRHPASLTKMMTLLMVFDAVNDGKLNENQTIRVSARAASMPASKLGIRAGSSISLQNAISSLATLSANDMAVALAETLGNGSESNFAKQMTARAQSIGMTRTRFYNASGLPNDYQVTTARDMARLARYMLAHYPMDSRIFSKQRFDYAGRTYMNHNHLMETYAGMDCCKTGFINASGFNLVASAKRGNRRLIGVVFGGRTTVSRNQQMAAMLDDGFAKAKTVVAAAKAQPPIQQAAPVAPAPIAQNPYAQQPAPLVAPTAQQEAIMAVAPAAAPTAVPPVQIQKITPPPVKIAKAIPAKLTPMPAPAPQMVANDSNPSQTLGTLKLQDESGIGDQAEAPQIDPPMQTASLTTPGNNPSSTGWSVQIGAYQTRLATDQAIERAFKKLPANLRKNQSTVVPLRTADSSWMFRARLTGYTQTEAEAACKYFKDCLTVSPQAY